MPHEVIMPALGMAQDTGRLTSWIKASGEPVAIGDALFEVETDKATMDVPSDAVGVITQVLVKTGDRVAPGAAIAVMQVEAAFMNALFQSSAVVSLWNLGTAETSSTWQL